MKRELELFFLTNLNKKAKLVIPEPRPDLTPQEISAVMDLVIEKNLFGFQQGIALSKADARIVESNIVKIEL